MRIRKNLAILTLQFDEVTVKTIYNNNIINVNEQKWTYWKQLIAIF